MKKCVTVVLALLVLVEPSAWAGLGSDKAMYIGGTIASIKQETEGKISTSDSKVFVFEYKGGRFTLPYDHIDSLEYGQKAGRRIAVAILVSPIAIFSKKRKHYLTIGYTDDDNKQQAMVLELGKDIVRVTLATLEARSGRKLEYQDEEARKSGKGN